MVNCVKCGKNLGIFDKKYDYNSNGVILKSCKKCKKELDLEEIRRKLEEEEKLKELQLKEKWKKLKEEEKQKELQLKEERKKLKEKEKEAKLKLKEEMKYVDLSNNLNKKTLGFDKYLNGDSLLDRITFPIKFENQLNSAEATYSEDEFIKFRKEYIQENIKIDFFNSDFWLINKYIINHKIESKILNLWIDLRIDLEANREVIGVPINKPVLIYLLNTTECFPYIELIRVLNKKKKMHLLDNFIQNSLGDSSVYASTEVFFGDDEKRRKLIAILKKSGIVISNDTILMKLLNDIWNSKKKSLFNIAIKENNPKKLDDFIFLFFEVYGENYNTNKFTLILELCKHNLDNQVTKITPFLEKKKEEYDLILFERRLENKTFEPLNIDSLNGYDFEVFISKLFRKMGYNVKVTKFSGDQGADLIAERFGEKFVIQAKRYSGKVSNKAIQEVVASIRHYNVDKGIVITNSEFTKSAIDLALSNKIELINKKKLKILVNKYLDDSY
jgi:HJR/Mrr/RecB family endonuclease